jgi:hypothetical protein
MLYFINKDKAVFCGISFDMLGVSESNEVEHDKKRNDRHAFGRGPGQQIGRADGQDGQASCLIRGKIPYYRLSSEQLY